jgi:signal transduction histidine kinase
LDRKDPRLKHPSQSRVDMVIIAKDGRRLNMEFSTCAVRGPQGEAVIVAIGRDMSEHDRITETLWRAASASFAHTIGNVLPSALYHLDLLCKDRSLAGRFKKEAQTAYDTVCNALTITRNYKIHCRASNRALIRSLVSMIHDTLKTNLAERFPPLSIDFQWDCSGSSHIAVDMESLKEAFESLVLDSVAFHPNRKPEIKITGSYSHSDMKYLIDYQDDGIGVSDDLRTRIFEPFFSTRRDGTGIGLTDVRNIILRHGGTIEEIGQSSSFSSGVYFRIKLPYADSFYDSTDSTSFQSVID